MRITRARMSDVRPLVLIMKEWVRETPWMPVLHQEPEDLKFMRHLIDDFEVTVIRGVMGGPQGFLARDGQIIHALYMRRGMRGRRYGKTLLDRVKGIEPRLELWTFQQNERARKFYAREAFQEVEMTDGAGNDEKLPDVRMVWEKGDD
ncbi:MAG: GNAT family N-acetyltransferase [Pseudomonadota bacterium]